MSNRRTTDRIRLIDMLERESDPNLLEVAVQIFVALVAGVCILGTFAVTFMLLLMLEPPL